MFKEIFIISLVITVSIELVYELWDRMREALKFYWFFSWGKVTDGEP